MIFLSMRMEWTIRKPVDWMPARCEGMFANQGPVAGWTSVHRVTTIVLGCVDETTPPTFFAAKERGGGRARVKGGRETEGGRKGEDSASVLVARLRKFAGFQGMGGKLHVPPPIHKVKLTP